MTEKEAIEVLKDFDSQVSAKADGAYQSTIGKMACDTAINALEEIQQYRAIGTVEELREAKQRQVPKKPTEDVYHHKCCPNCDWVVFQDEWGGRYLPHCENCGQKIDWSEEE